MSASPTSHTYAPRPVSQPFGKYHLFERIGAGGMAEVFRAIVVGPENFQRTLVIKRILPQLSHDPTFVRMFIDEAKVSAILSHPNLVQIFEFGKVGESFFIAMEYVQGRTLAAAAKKLFQLGRVAPVAASVEIARQLCVGLDYAHALRSIDGHTLSIVHRDISPANLMVSFHGVVKILDFGIARVAAGMRQTQTQVGALKGKIAYMSPEQLQMHPIDGRSDIFSVGIVLHELLSGRRLFRAPSDYASSRMVVEMPILPPSTYNASVSATLDRAVMRALNRDVNARYLTAGEMAADLEQVIEESDLSPREHIRLLRELFPDEAAAAGDTGMAMGAEVRPHAPSEDVLTPLVNVVAHETVATRAPSGAVQPLSSPSASAAPPSEVTPPSPPQSRRRLVLWSLATVTLAAGIAAVWLGTRTPISQSLRPAAATSAGAAVVVGVETAPRIQPAAAAPVASRGGAPEAALPAAPSNAGANRIGPRRAKSNHPGPRTKAMPEREAGNAVRTAKPIDPFSM